MVLNPEHGLKSITHKGENERAEKSQVICVKSFRINLQFCFLALNLTSTIAEMSWLFCFDLSTICKLGNTFFACLLLPAVQVGGWDTQCSAEYSEILAVIWLYYNKNSEKKLYYLILPCNSSARKQPALLCGLFCRGAPRTTETLLQMAW